MDDFDETPPWPSSSEEMHDELLDEIDLTQEKKVEKESPEVAPSANPGSEAATSHINTCKLHR